MTYRIKEDKKEELKGGMTIRAMAKIIGINNTYLTNILNGFYPCKKNIAFALINLKERVWIGSRECEEFLDYYFVKEEEE